MALNIKNPLVEALAAEVARMAGETMTLAVRRALEERRDKLRLRGTDRPRATHLREFLRREVWPELGRVGTVSKQEREAILGYGPEGV